MSRARRGYQAFALSLAGLLLAACTRVEVEDHSLQFNQAAGSLGNRLLLLNAVRSAKGYPLQFSRLTNYTGQSRLDGSLSLGLPFVANTIGKPSDTRLLGSVAPSASFRSGVSNLQLTDLNTAEIQLKLREIVKANDFAYYRSQGWQKALVNTILIENISVDPRLVKALEDAAATACAGSGRVKHKDECRWLRSDAVKRCFRSREALEERASPDGDLVVVYSNNPRKICQHLGFQWVFTAIRVLAGASLDLDPKVDTDECKTPRALLNDITGAAGGKAEKSKSKDDKEGFSQTVKEGKVSVEVAVKVSEKREKDDDDSSRSKERGGSIGLNIPKGARDSLGLLDINELAALARLRNEQLCILKEQRKPIDISYRSPERMVRYLGDVVAVQSFRAGDHSGRIQILNDEGDPVDIFRVEQKRDLMGTVAVSIEDPEGADFVIPVPDRGSKTEHLSLQALALVMESFNLAVSGKALPQPATILLSGG